MNNSYTIVYLIESTDNDKSIYKIGFTKNSAKLRIKNLNTGTASNLKIIFEYKSLIGRKLEAALHNFYKCKRIKGEWFELDLNEIVNFEDFCKKVESNLLLMYKENTIYNKNKK